MDEKIKELTEKAIEDKVFPGCSIGVLKNGERAYIPSGRFTYDDNSEVVKADTIYDVASLTKSLATASALLKLIDEGKLSLGDKVVKFIPEFDTSPEKREVTVWHLLTYTLDLNVPSMASLKNLSVEEASKIVIGANLKSLPGTKYLYTNSTAFIMGLLFWRASGVQLDVFCEEEFYKPLGMTKTTFHPEKLDRNEIVPTEIDDWRGREIRGEVHDESTFLAQSKGLYLGAAGLFSSAPDILNFMEMLMSGGEMNGKKFFSSQIVEQMYTNQLSAIGLQNGLGWEIDQNVLIGKPVEYRLFGKTGFTGCVVVANPNRKIALVILSNRTYPKRPPNNLAIREFRTKVSDIVFA